MLAEHYLSAFRARPEGSEGEDVAAEARRALRAAGARAKSLGSMQQAASFFELALEVTVEPADLADLHLRASDAMLAGWLTPEVATEHARQALDAMEQRLVDPEAGIIRLLAPAFDRVREAVVPNAIAIAREIPLVVCTPR